MAQKPSYEELEKEIFKLKGVEDALQKNEEKFRLLYERAPLGYQSLDENGNFIEVNQAWLDSLGYTREEVIGRSFGDFLHREWVDHFKENFPRFKAVGEILGVEFEMVKKDGSLILVSINGKIGKDEKGDFKQTHCILHDITLQKSAEKALRESEEKHRNLFETMVQGVVYQDADGQVCSANPTAERILGLTLDQMRGRTSIDPRWKSIHEDGSDFPGETHPSMVALKTGNLVNNVIMGVFNPSKEDYCWISINAVPQFKAGESKPYQVFTLFTDITERKRAEEALRESEERLKSFYLAAFEGIAIADQGKIIDFNRQFADIFGYEPDELIGKEVIDLVADEDRELVSGNIRSGFDQPYEFKGLHKDGSILYIEVHGQQIQFQERPVRVAAIQDLTKRKRVEEALRESEEKYRQLFATVTDSIMLFDPDTRKILDVNDAALHLYGYSREEFLKLTQTDITAEPEESDKTIQQTIAGEILRIPLRYHKRKDGTIFPVEISSSTMKLGEETVLCGVIRDITERKKAEKEIEEKTHFNQTLLDALPCVALLLRPSTREVVASNAAARKAGAFPGKTCFGTWAQRDDPCPWCLAPKVWETNEAQHLEVGALDIIWDAHWFPIQEDLYLHYAFDITEKRKLEAQFQRSQKMESMGLMAGGIAHDLNNILSGIVSYPELILMDLPEDSKLRKPIETIKDSGMRAADVVSDLLTIARGVASGKEVLNLNSMVEEYLDSVEHQNLTTMHSFITFKTDFDNDLLNIICSSTHIRKSLVNLTLNAAEAIKGDGMVKISTMNRYLDEPLKGYENVKKGEYAVLSVSDDGSGISSDDLERIFEPFYTKKVMGRSGTGLGLAVVWNTVQDHNGYINVTTSGKGTTFELYFPVTREEAAAEKIDISMKDYIGHGERILVVDDEEQQREIACNILVRLDYKAEAVSSGEEAVEYLKKQSVDLVVLDMIMPKGINGRETYEEIIKIHPKQKAIIASGFSETTDVKKAQKLGAGKYIKKPYTMGKIGLAVKEELEK